VPKSKHQDEKKKMNQKEKKKRNEVSQKELLATITALEEIVMAEMPKDWEKKAKDKIYRKLMEKGELSRSSLYQAVRGDRMGLATFSKALQGLEEDEKIKVTKQDTKGRPVEIIRLSGRDI